MIGGFAAQAKNLTLRLLPQFLPALLLLALPAVQSAEPPVRIVTLGDSITKGVRPGVKREQTFAALLEAGLKGKGLDAEVINVGIGGERTDQALRRLDKDVIARGPAVVTIMYGTNDSYVDAGKKQSRLSQEQYEANLQALLAKLRHAHIRPILMTEPRWGINAKLNGVGEHPNVRLERYMKACRKVARETNTPLVDNFHYWSEKQTAGTDVGRWTTDNCHPNPVGHREISALMLPVVLKQIRSTKSAARLSHSTRYRVRLSITTPLKYCNVPLDPTIDFSAILKQAGASGVFDPNSIAVINLATGDQVPFARNEDFAYSDRGRLEWVVSQPQHTEYEIRFSVAEKRPTLLPQVDTPAIGVGDLLRYNAQRPRPITLFYSIGLHDLTGDGRPDLVGTWNYARRPGRPWDGIVCYPRVSGRRSNKTESAATTENTGEHRYQFSDLTRLRYSRQSDSAQLSFLGGLYSSADFADFNGDGRLDLVSTRSDANAASFFLNTGERDIGGLPIFAPAGTAKITGWQACRAVDLNGDGAIDLIVDGQLVKNVADNSWPFKAADPVKLDAGRLPCFFDVDRDGLLDAVCLHGDKAILPDFYRVAWRKNLGGDPPKFGQETLIDDINVQSSFVSSYADGGQTGLLVQHNSFQEISVYQLVSKSGEQPRFERRGRAESVSAAMALSDQAWPCLCDWDDDGDVDLLVGGGYGWPRIVINEGTRHQPRFAEPRLILADGKPIRFVRNQILGQPHNWHNMGYSYPDFVDWDGDGLRDLIIPNETNRIFWYRNMGTLKRPKFGRRRQILCDGFPDSPELRKLSAQRAIDPTARPAKRRCSRSTGMNRVS
jgi:acyl-CoA thioesterase-1